VSEAAALFALPPALALGSFLNVVAARLPEHRSLVTPGSTCVCGAPIAWHDNVPVVSYLFLRGRCRDCGVSISPRYPLVELTTGLLVAACFLRFGVTAEAFLASFFVTVLVVLSAIDAERKILPDVIVLPSAAIVLAAHVAIAPDQALEWVGASLGASLFLFVLVLAYPRGMGMGDVKLALLLGAALGRGVAVAIMLGAIAALVFGLVLIARKGAEGRRTAIPFGPFLAFGSIVVLFAGEWILDEYLTLS
jgi:leader peptidase (prepilin peptidase)/N-methyltransferase